MTRPIRFNAFDMNCVAHQSPGLWRHPEDRSRDYNTLAYWTELAKLLEIGRFDGLFIADVLGTYDVYGASHDAALRAATQVPVNDPLLLVSAMAAVTEHLGFGITAGTAYEHPYPFARRMSTLDHLTNGRVGWNVVTGYLASAARNMGAADQMNHDDRYDYADEYMDVLYKLWEGSWEDDAVRADKQSGPFTDPAKVHDIDHHGRFFDVPGIHLCEPSPQRTPLIYQAGASPRGLAFAARHAEAIFTGAPARDTLADTVTNIRAALVDAGRDPYAARIYNLLTIVTAATDTEAQEKYAEYQSYADTEGALVLSAGWMGVDLATYAVTDPIGDVQSNAIRSAVANVQRAEGSDGTWTIGDIGRWTSIGGLGPVVVGSAATVADELQEWIADTDVDGFNLAYAITPGTFADVVEHVVPELQRRGVYPTDYGPARTWRRRLFDAGDRLPAEHHGAQFRAAQPTPAGS